MSNLILLIKDTLLKRASAIFYIVLNLTVPKSSYFHGIPETEDEKNDCGDTSAKRRSLFQCPGCSNVPLPPIFMCNVGHHICSTCRQTLETCPLCSACYTGQARNHVMESIVSTSLFACRYKADGCKWTCRAFELPFHEENCSFRHLRCGIAGKCCDGNWVGSPGMLYAHLASSHQMQLIFPAKNVIFKARVNPVSLQFQELIMPEAWLRVIKGQNYVVYAQYIAGKKMLNVKIRKLYRDIAHEEPGTTNLGKMSSHIQTGAYDKTGRDSGQDTTVVGGSIKLVRSTKRKNDNAFDPTWVGQVSRIDEQDSDKFPSGFLAPWLQIMEAATIQDSIASWEMKIDIYPPILTSPSWRASEGSCDALRKTNTFLECLPLSTKWKRIDIAGLDQLTLDMWPNLCAFSSHNLDCGECVFNNPIGMSSS